MDFAIYRDCQNRMTGGHIEIMLIIEITKLVLFGGHIGIMLFTENNIKELTGYHIRLC